MAASSVIHCPRCKATLRLPKPFPSGKQIGCPKCHQRFSFQVPTETSRQEPESYAVADESSSAAPEQVCRKSVTQLQGSTPGPEAKRSALSALLWRCALGVICLLPVIPLESIGYFVIKDAQRAVPIERRLSTTKIIAVNAVFWLSWFVFTTRAFWREASRSFLATNRSMIWSFVLGGVIPTLLYWQALLMFRAARTGGKVRIVSSTWTDVIVGCVFSWVLGLVVGPLLLMFARFDIELPAALGGKQMQLSQDAASVIHKLDKQLPLHQIEALKQTCRAVERMHDDKRLTDDEYQAIHKVCGPASEGKWDRAADNLQTLMQLLSNKQ